MDIQAARHLFSTTFGKKVGAASRKDIPPVDAVHPAKHSRNPLARNPTPDQRQAEPSPLSEQTADPQSPTIVVEHQSDRFSKVYLTVAKTGVKKYQIDTFA